MTSKDSPTEKEIQEALAWLDKAKTGTGARQNRLLKKLASAYRTAQALIVSQSDVIEKMRVALRRSQYGIDTAICDEDGLDGAIGQEIMREIDQVLSLQPSSDAGAAIIKERDEYRAGKATCCRGAEIVRERAEAAETRIKELEAVLQGRTASCVCAGAKDAEIARLRSILSEADECLTDMGWHTDRGLLMRIRAALQGRTVSCVCGAQERCNQADKDIHTAEGKIVDLLKENAAKDSEIVALKAECLRLQKEVERLDKGQAVAGLYIRQRRMKNETTLG